MNGKTKAWTIATGVVALVGAALLVGGKVFSTGAHIERTRTTVEHHGVQMQQMQQTVREIGRKSDVRHEQNQDEFKAIRAEQRAYYDKLSDKLDELKK